MRGRAGEERESLAIQRAEEEVASCVPRAFSQLCRVWRALIVRIELRKVSDRYIRSGEEDRLRWGRGGLW